VTEKVLYAVDRGVARVTLNRPEKRNALDDDLIAGVRQALTESSLDGSVRVVLVGAVGNDFCSGADLAALERSTSVGVMENLADARRLGDLFLAMRRHPRPVVAAVRGRALAGGCGLATAADIVLATESARFGYPEVNLAFVPAMVMAILRRSLSEKRALELLTGGEVISAERAVEFGIINHVYPDAAFDTEVESYVAKLATRSASALTLTKSLLYQMDGLPFEAALSAGVQTNVLARLTDDFRSGVEHFLKKS